MTGKSDLHGGRGSGACLGTLRHYDSPQRSDLFHANDSKREERGCIDHDEERQAAREPEHAGPREEMQGKACGARGQEHAHDAPAER